MSLAKSDDPFVILGVPRDSGDAQIRSAYLRLLRIHAPEQDPEGFQRIRAAFEAIRGTQDRLARAILERPQLPDVAHLIAELGQEELPLGKQEIGRLLRTLLIDMLPALALDPGRELRPIPPNLPQEEEIPSSGHLPQGTEKRNSKRS